MINLGPNSGLFQNRHRRSLLKLASVVFTRVNEIATAASRRQTPRPALMKQVETPAYLAISERTMEFDGKGKCLSGC